MLRLIRLFDGLLAPPAPAGGERARRSLVGAAMIAAAAPCAFLGLEVASRFGGMATRGWHRVPAVWSGSVAACLLLLLILPAIGVARLARLDERLRDGGLDGDLALTPTSLGRVRTAQVVAAGMKPLLLAVALLVGMGGWWSVAGLHHDAPRAAWLVPALTLASTLHGFVAGALLLMALPRRLPFRFLLPAIAAALLPVAVLALDRVLAWPLYPAMLPQARFGETLGFVGPQARELPATWTYEPGHTSPNVALMHVEGRAPSFFGTTGLVVLGIALLFFVAWQFLPRRTPVGLRRLGRDALMFVLLAVVALAALFLARDGMVRAAWPIVYFETASLAALQAMATGGWLVAWADVRWHPFVVE